MTQRVVLAVVSLAVAVVVVVMMVPELREGAHVDVFVEGAMVDASVPPVPDIEHTEDDGILVRVEWSDGEPAVGVTVEVEDDARAALRVETDETGRAHFASLEAAKYTVRLLRSGGGYRPIEFVDVKDGEVVDVLLQIEDGLDIEGLVVDERRRPIAGASVMIETFAAFPPAMGDTTNEDGRFSLRDVSHLATLLVQHPRYQASELIRCRDEEPVTVELLDGAVSLRGVVRDESGNAVPNATVEMGWGMSPGRILASPFVHGLQVTSTDDEGRYAFTQLRVGVAKILARMPGFERSTVIHDLPELGVNELDITLRSSWSVSGVITDEAGEPIKGAWLRYGGVFDERNTATSDATGAFVLDELRVDWNDGGKVIQVSHNDYLPATSEGAFVVGPVVEWNPVLAVGGVITGSVWGPDGEPVVTGRADCMQGEERVKATGIRDGRFRLAGLEDGVYVVEIHDEASGRVALQKDVSPDDDLTFHVERFGPGRVRGRLVHEGDDEPELVLRRGYQTIELEIDDAGVFDQEVPAGEYRVDVPRWPFRDVMVRGEVIAYVRPGELADVGDVELEARALPTPWTREEATKVDVVVMVTLTNGVSAKDLELSLGRGQGRPPFGSLKHLGDGEYKTGPREVGMYQLFVRGDGVASDEHEVHVSEDNDEPIWITVTKGHKLALEVGTGDDGSITSVLDVVVRDSVGRQVFSRTLPTMKGARPLTLWLAPGWYTVTVTDDKRRQAVESVEMTKNGVSLAVSIP